MAEILVEILVDVLSVLALATKEVKQGILQSFRKFLSRAFCGGSKFVKIQKIQKIQKIPENTFLVSNLLLIVIILT